MNASGFLLYDKPALRTSFDALSEFKRLEPTTKFGHAGTLDRFATGLLVVLAGSYVRLTPWFQGLDKSYCAEVRFGTGTDTLDSDGKIVMTGEPPSRKALELCLPSFTGPQEQIPPEYSAVHYNGARASSLARKGQHPVLQSRRIEISELKLVSYDGENAVLEVSCSSGTYIRALARDIAVACSSCAYVSALKRTRIGPFLLDSASQNQCFDSSPAVVTNGQENASPTKSSGLPVWQKLSAETALQLGLAVAYLPRSFEEQFIHGYPGALSCISAVTTGAVMTQQMDVAVFSESGDFLGIVQKTSKDYRYKVVMQMDALGSNQGETYYGS
ncbi:MAG TPA: tRNA pseudouridine(55) synthase TruB [Spirochaetales bacterium]|nr:tRNA pseudouridine(55) synthase TruB [Spirochaetales bacterium]